MSDERITVYRPTGRCAFRVGDMEVMVTPPGADEAKQCVQLATWLCDRAAQFIRSPKGPNGAVFWQGVRETR